MTSKRENWYIKFKANAFIDDTNNKSATPNHHEEKIRRQKANGEKKIEEKYGAW